METPHQILIRAARRDEAERAQAEQEARDLIDQDPWGHAAAQLSEEAAAKVLIRQSIYQVEIFAPLDEKTPAFDQAVADLQAVGYGVTLHEGQLLDHAGEERAGVYVRVTLD